MVGTTDIRVEDPEQVYCTDDEVKYMLNLVNKVFPSIKVEPSQIVFRFSGVRPLPASGSSFTGAISRDHSIQTVPVGNGRTYPIHSLVGGKWTSFRAFSEQATDLALQNLGNKRRVSTQQLPIGGGENYPVDETAKQAWLRELQSSTELSLEHLSLLFDRYGTYAAKVAKYISQANDTPLQSVPHYTRREILFLIEHEKVEHLGDLLLRRTLIAMLGDASAEALTEMGQLLGQVKGWNAEKIQQDIMQAQALLAQRHGLNFTGVPSN
jgi:glycerol-3-phosphate dehydrogenase